MSGLFEVFGNTVVDPIPKAILIDDLLHGLRIDGRDPNTGEYPETIEQQLVNAYATMRDSVEAAGASVDNIGQVSFYLQNFDHRALINDPWNEMFTDAEDRPTYKFMPADLPGEQLVHMEYFAVPGARRRDLHVQGVAHTNPIPMAVHIGRYVFSSRMLPYDPATEKAATTTEAQADFIFQHAKRILDDAGFTWSDVVQGRGFFVQEEMFPLISSRWMERFPDATSRPPLHPIRYGAGGLQVMLEFIARQGG
jgi:2-iminobutanoate/2-iminopropanoate deaminase